MAVTREIGKKQVRAYVSIRSVNESSQKALITPAELGDDLELLEIIISFQNTGNSPATNARCEITGVFLRHDLSRTMQVLGDISGGASDEKVMLFLRRDKKVPDHVNWDAFSIEYFNTDVFGVEHRKRELWRRDFGQDFRRMLSVRDSEQGE